MYKVDIDGSKCIGCLYCQLLCKAGVLDVKSGALCYVADISRCVGCKACEAGCPEHAITVSEN